MEENLDKNQLLRFSTAGSVDDGKSTLIGRLLYDSKSIFEDQLASVENTSRRKGHETVDLAMFTDGLREEREQGITIDVAYRYFTTPKRLWLKKRDSVPPKDLPMRLKVIRGFLWDFLLRNWRVSKEKRQ